MSYIRKARENEINAEKAARFDALENIQRNRIEADRIANIKINEEYGRIDRMMKESTRRLDEARILNEERRLKELAYEEAQRKNALAEEESIDISDLLDYDLSEEESDEIEEIVNELNGEDEDEDEDDEKKELLDFINSL